MQLLICVLDNEIKKMKSAVMRISHELQAQKEKIKENAEILMCFLFRYDSHAQIIIFQC